MEVIDPSDRDVEASKLKSERTRALASRQTVAAHAARHGITGGQGAPQHPVGIKIPGGNGVLENHGLTLGGLKEIYAVPSIITYLENHNISLDRQKGGPRLNPCASTGSDRVKARGDHGSGRLLF